MISQDLMDTIRRGFALSLGGIHGEAHWARVYENGRRLSEQTGADQEVVDLFAYLHDSQRQDDGWDAEHGQRAAALIRGVYRPLLALAEDRLERLAFACACHTQGLTEADVTVQTCWDADRLDLGRIGVHPTPSRLCTPAARDPATIEWAVGRSWRERRRFG